MDADSIAPALRSLFQGGSYTVNQYELERSLGQGGMGLVVAARDTRLQRQVALKFMNRELASRPAARRMFLSEARALAALNHENIVRVYEVAEFRDIPFLAMEMLDGESLDKLIARGFPFGNRQIVRIGYQVASGLAVAHEAGIIHRDVKPANVILSLPAGNVRVLDFGLSRSAQAIEHDDGERLAGNPDSSLSTGEARSSISDSVIVGTPGYMSPEQATDQPVDARSDVYSLGVLMYRLLTGRLPFEGESNAEILVRQLTEPPPRVDCESLGIPRELGGLIGQCLQREPAARPARASSVRDELRSIYASIEPAPTIVPTKLVDVTVRQSPSSQSSKRSSPGIPHWGIAVAGLFGLIILLGTLVAAKMWRTSEPTTSVRASEPAELNRTRGSNLAVPDKPAGRDRSRLDDDADARSTADPIQAEELPDNVPDALRDAFLIRTDQRFGIDTYVESGSTDDFSGEGEVRVSLPRKSEGIPRRFGFLRFDLSSIKDRKQDVVDAYLLLTYKRRFFGDEPKFRLEVSVLRDDSPHAKWQASGPKRIRFSSNPVEVSGIDLIEAGGATGTLSGWHTGRKTVMLQHRNGRLIQADPTRYGRRVNDHVVSRRGNEGTGRDRFRQPRRPLRMVPMPCDPLCRNENEVNGIERE